VIIRRLIVPLTFAAVALYAGQVFAQGALAAPPPGQDAASDTCMNGFAPLRAEAEKRGRLIKAASERHAPPDEACKLIGNFRQSEIKMIKYVEANSGTCGISPELADHLRAGNKRTEAKLKTVCAAARGEPTGLVGDFDDIGAGRL
jgi:hypothetical protein